MSQTRSMIENDDRLRVRLLGRLRLWHGPAEIPTRPGQQRAIVALLALAAGQPVHRREIAEALWAATPPPAAGNVIQTHVKRLRAALEPGRRTRTGSVLLPRSGDGYALRVHQDDVDLLRFAALTQRARDAQRGDRQPEAFALLGEALGEWRADPLADVPLLAEHPAVAAAVRHRWTAIGWYADAGLALGRAGEVLAAAEMAASANPLDEQAQARLIRLYQVLGRRDEAFATFRDTRRRLVEGLGVEPGAELQDAYQRGLRAVAEPYPPAELPGDIADFTGRRSEIDRIRRRLAPARPAPPGRAATVVALVGMGGVGKTTLALHVGHQVAADFPDGQLYVRLRGATRAPVPPTEILGRLLLALGVPGSAIPDGEPERAGLYRSRLAGRRVLLVLDDATDEAQVRPLLPSSSTCAVVVTSRGRLGALAGATAVDVDVMDGDTGLALLRRLVGAHRVQAEAAAAAEIAEICGGVPLAIRVIGARLAARPHQRLAWLAGRLRDERRRLDELSTGDLAVRSSLALSYAGIPAPARRAIRMLSLLDTHDVADWPLAALLDCPQERADSLIDVLVDAHLLALNGTDATGAPRYRLHDLVRLYARERAQALDPPAARAEAVTRAVGAWLHLAEVADERLACRYLSRRPGPAARRPPAEDVVARVRAAPDAWFEAERANIIAVIGQAAGAGGEAQAWNLADAALGFYEMRDLRDDWTAGHLAALAACRAAADGPGSAVMSRNLAYRASAAQVCDVDRMRSYAEAAYALFIASGDTGGQADALILLGEVKRTAGAGRAASARFNQALRLARADGHALTQSVAHNEIAFLWHERGNPREAARHCRHSLRLCAEHGNVRPRYGALRLLGVIQIGLDQNTPGEANLREALNLARAMRSPVKQARVLREIGGLQLGDGRTGEAAATLAEAYRLSVAAADRVEVAWTQRWLGRLALAQGDPEQAARTLGKALDTFTDAGLTYATALTLRDLGTALVAGRDHHGARQRFREARRLYVKLSNARSVAVVDELAREAARR